MKITQQFRRQYRIQYLTFIVLFLSIIISIAWLSTQYVTQSDWTAGKRNSLTDDTIKLVKNISGPVHIRSYQTDDISFQQAVTEILSRYQKHKHNLHFELLNPDLDIEQAKLDGISSYGQTVISYNDKQEIINTLNEQNIGNALLRLSRERKPTLFFLQGHGERNPTDTSAIGYSNITKQLQINGFGLRGLNLLRDALDPDDGTLIIAGASHKILAGEIQQINDFITQGGSMLWLQDPEAPDEFNSLLDLFKINFIKGVVVDTNPQLREVLRLSHPAKLPIISYKMHSITKNMQNFTLFVTAAAISSSPINEPHKNDWKTSPLLLTQDTSWAETQGFILDVKYNQNSGDTQGPLTIGVALERTLPEQNNKQQRIVVIGDSDFLSNNNLGHGANLDLILNIMNWLSNDEQLISINTKSAPDFKLELSDTEIAIIGFGFLLGLPGLFTFTGIFIWFKRRNQ
jgi:gliding motility-associatede transport system auxiliary component